LHCFQEEPKTDPVASLRRRDGVVCRPTPPNCFSEVGRKACPFSHAGEKKAKQNPYILENKSYPQKVA